MFDFGWSELALIALVALVVIGPKDLPRALKTAGVFVRKARSMAREFQNTVDDMIREADLEDAKKQVEAIGAMDLKREVENAVDASGELRAALEPSILPPTPAEPPAPLLPPQSPAPPSAAVSPPPAAADDPVIPELPVEPEPDAEIHPRAERDVPVPAGAPGARPPAP